MRDKVARARYQLPQDVEPPVVDKEDFGNEPVLWVPVNSDRPLVEASEYVRRSMKPRLETIQGVASVVLFGERERAIRIWLDGEAHARARPRRDGHPRGGAARARRAARAARCRATGSSTPSRPTPSSARSTSCPG